MVRYPHHGADRRMANAATLQHHSSLPLPLPPPPRQQDMRRDRATISHAPPPQPSNSNKPSNKSKGKFITSREQKKQFDQAVKEVIRQRQGKSKKPPPSQAGGGGGSRGQRLERNDRGSSSDRLSSLGSSMTDRRNQAAIAGWHNALSTLRAQGRGGTVVVGGGGGHNRGRDYNSAGGGGGGDDVRRYSTMTHAYRRSTVDPPIPSNYYSNGRRGGGGGVPPSLLENRRSSDGDTPLGANSSPGGTKLDWDDLSPAAAAAAEGGGAAAFRRTIANHPSKRWTADPGTLSRSIKDMSEEIKAEEEKEEEEEEEQEKPPAAAVAAPTQSTGLLKLKMAASSLIGGNAPPVPPPARQSRSTSVGRSGQSQSSENSTESYNTFLKLCSQDGGGNDHREGTAAAAAAERGVVSGLADVKIQDLVPTRRLSQSAHGEGEEIHGKEEQAGTTTAGAEEDDLEDNGLRKSMDTCEDSWGGGSSTNWGSLLGFGKKPSPLEAQPSDVSDQSYATARSRDPSPSPSLTDRDSEPQRERGGNNPSKGDPRSQFGLMKAQAKSSADVTGKTEGSSTSTIFSSTRSAQENDPTADPNKNGGSSRNLGGGGFEAIREEEKELRTSKNSNGSGREDGASLRDSFLSMQAEAHDSFSAATPTFGSYKKKKSARLTKIRRGIRKSFGQKQDASSSGMSAASNGGSSISAEHREQVTRHLERKQSNRSMTSAISSFSGMTGNSDASSTASGRLWGRFKLKGVRPKMPKSHSMYNIPGGGGGGDDDGGSETPSRGSQQGGRHILVKHRQGSANSQVSTLSDDEYSRTSGITNGSGVFSDFYDHSDHMRAVSSVISSKGMRRKSISGRKLSAHSLPTVEEPAYEGGQHGGGGNASSASEQKHDEDYHYKRERQMSAYQQYQESSKDLSDSFNSLYRHPSHEHALVHMRPNQLFPDSPGWQCDVCCKETFDSNVWAFVSTEQNYLLCEECFKNKGFSLAG